MNTLLTPKQQWADIIDEWSGTDQSIVDFLSATRY